MLTKYSLKQLYKFSEALGNYLKDSGKIDSYEIEENASGHYRYNSFPSNIEFTVEKDGIILSVRFLANAYSAESSFDISTESGLKSAKKEYFEKFNKLFK